MAKNTVRVGPERWAMLKAWQSDTRVLAEYHPVLVQRVEGKTGILQGIRATYRDGKGNLQSDYIAKRYIVSLRYYRS